MHVRAAVFDFFGTLTPSRPKNVRDAEKQSTADLLDIPRKDWIRAVDATYSERVLGIDENLAAAFARIAGNAGYRPSSQRVAAAMVERLDSYLDACAVRDDVLDGLTRLRATGLKIGLLTDCSIELPSVWSRLPVSALIDAPVFSCQEHSRKPDPALFATVASRLGVAKTECLYVGDGGGDELTGSSRAGMRTILFRPSDWADHDAAERAMGWSGPEVSSMTDLAQRLSEFVRPDAHAS